MIKSAISGNFFENWLPNWGGKLKNFLQARIELNQSYDLIPPYLDRERLHKEYMENQKSLNQIAREWRCSRAALRKQLSIHQIPLRAETLEFQRRGQLAYGERLIQKRLIRNKREVEVVEKMLALRQEGYSYWKIANVLTLMKIPTKNRRSGWKAATVMKILNRNKC
jgi:hypothetical protein